MYDGAKKSLYVEFLIIHIYIYFFLGHCFR